MLPVAILAGGLGTRLGAVAGTTPKILIDIDGRPFAEYQIDWLRAHGDSAGGWEIKAGDHLQQG